MCAGPHACTCHPIDDLAAFVEAVIEAHFAAGAKRRDGSLTAAARLTRDDREDLHQQLLLEALVAARRFSGSGRLNGWVLWILHKRCVDFIRARFGSTRYRPRAELVPFDPQVHDIATVDDALELVGEPGRRLDRASLSDRALEELALLELALETDMSPSDVAAELGLRPIRADLKFLRAEARLVDEQRELVAVGPS